jgi:hypothetical protein
MILSNRFCKISCIPNYGTSLFAEILLLHGVCPIDSVTGFEKMIRGEMPEPRTERGLHGVAIRGIEALAWLADGPGQSYRLEAEQHRLRRTASPSASARDGARRRLDRVAT